MYSTIVHALEGQRQEGGSTEVVVIGGGVVGAATALALARRGSRVSLLESSGLADPRGSSAGTARIYAPAAYPDESYLEMGLRAVEQWREVERRSGESLLRRTGALTHGRFAARQMEAMEAAGVAAQFVSPESALRSFGVRVADDGALLHQPDAGIILADRARAVLLRMAAAAGAEVRGGVRVRSITEAGAAVELDTDGGRFRCSVAVVAAGPWSRRLLASAGIEVPLTVSSQSVAYFGLRDPSAKPVALMEFEGDEPYALWDPEHGLKAALHARGPAAEPDHPLDADPATIDRVADWVATTFAGVGDRPATVQTCLYTNTPDERFMLERRRRIVVASACNGQGFQFAPETGERVAQLALESAALSEATT